MVVVVYSFINLTFDPGLAQLPPKTAVHVSLCLDARPCGTTTSGEVSR